MWSVVTPVPAGTHEFKFVVDGEWKHSTRHPTVGEDDETMNNIRVIRGPPKNKQNTARLSEQRNKDAGVTTTKQKKCCIVSSRLFFTILIKRSAPSESSCRSGTTCHHLFLPLPLRNGYLTHHSVLSQPSHENIEQMRSTTLSLLSGTPRMLLT